MGERHEDTRGYDGKYHQLAWATNCVLQALSKVLHESTGEIAKELVDRGPLDRIDLLENGSAIKKAVDHYKLKPLVEGGADWKTVKHRLNGKEGEYFAIWWGNGGTEESWTDRGGTSHAFTVNVIGSKAELPKTNMSDFDKSHPTGTEWVSVWKSPASKTHTLRPVIKEGERRVDLG